MTTCAAHQLANELDARLQAWAPLVGVGDVLELSRRLRAAAERTVAELAQDGGDRLAAEAALTVMSILYPEADPSPEWWSTQLGRLVARSLGRDDAEAWSPTVAGAVLGVTKGTIDQLRHRGVLERHPDGGLTRSSVLAYLLARRER